MIKLIERVGFTDPEGAQVIDLTEQALVSESLKEGKIECVEKEKVSENVWGPACKSWTSLIAFPSHPSVRTSTSTTSCCATLARHWSS